jgi:hypothetical protein
MDTAVAAAMTMGQQKATPANPDVAKIKRNRADD